MSFFFKNTKKFSIIFTALLLAITLTAGSFAAVANGLPDEPEASSEVTDMINDGINFDGSEPEYLDIGGGELPIVEMSFNMPSDMKATYLVPGGDFLKTAGDSADTVKKQIDDTLAAVKKLDMNTVIIDTVYGENVMYNTSGADPKLPDFDVTEYITDKSRENGLYVYAVFDASHYSGTEKLEEAASAFAAKYKLDGILADGYEGNPDSVDYGEYIKSGGSMGYDNFLNQRAAAIAKTMSQAVRKAAPDTQIGILVNPVWANASDDKDGSNTNAEYTSLLSGYADTKRYIELGWFDFVAVKADTGIRDEAAPFSEVASWWSKLAEKKSIPLYMVYPTSKVGANGWTSSSIEEQAAFAANENAYRGAIFDSIKNVPGSSNTAVVEVTPTSVTNTGSNAASLVTPLPSAPVAAAPAKPAEAPEPEPEPEEIWDDETGEELWDDYEDNENDYYGGDDESDWSGSYGDEDEYGWMDEILSDDAYFSVSSSGTRYAVEITADQASTFPVSTKNRIPSAAMYPLPKGAIDYTNGKVVAFTSGGIKYRHIILESGYRVDIEDVKRVNSGPKNNSINSLSLSNKSGYTYITLKTEQRVTYSVRYTGKEFIITFDNTTSVPSASKLASNPMFSKAEWSGKNRLTLTLAKTYGFMGYKGYYDGNNLVFRFNQPPSSIKNAKIFVDPGHGGTDVGATGKNPKVYEKDINLAIAKKVAAELTSRGATVKLLDTSKTIRGPERLLEAEKWGADIIVSVHSNTAVNTAAKGTEVYYFYPFAKQLASNAALNASKYFESTNRGAKEGTYHIILSSQMPSVLVETGFMTNTSDYAKLLKASYHQRLAVGIANGVEGALKTAYTGKVSNGTEFKSPNNVPLTGRDDDTVSGSEDESTGAQSTIDVSGIALSKAADAYLEEEYITLYPGTKYRIEIVSEDGKVIRGADFKWKSDDTKIASVNASGIVTARSVGDAVITATGGGYTLECDIEVSRTKVAVKGISLEEASITLVRNTNKALRATVLPKNAADQAIRWSSSDTKVAEVNENGVVTGKRAGTATITARTKSGGYIATCRVEVLSKAVALEEITAIFPKFEMWVGDSDVMEVEFYPENTTSDLSLTYTSSNSKVVSVDSEGNLKALAPGTATITAASKSNSRIRTTCKITVIK